MPLREAEAATVPLPTRRFCTESPGQESGMSGTTERLLAGPVGADAEEVMDHRPLDPV